MVINFETSNGKFAFVDIYFEWDINNPLQVSMGIEQEMLKIKKHYHPLHIKELGLVKDLTEEQWIEVVDKANDELIDITNSHWRDYNSDNWENNFKTAEESGKSLMESLNLKENNLFLIKYL